MCTTCGCGHDDHIQILQPKKVNASVKVNAFSPVNAHTHNHTHSHIHPQELTKEVIELERDILHQNDVAASRNRGFFEAKNITTFNLVSSPGSGKTSFLERCLTDLKSELNFFVIEGDQQTLNDANRIEAVQVPVIQINTGKGCHLDGEMVYRALKQLNPTENSVLMIENVGNLVCPAMFDLGEDQRIVIISTTEGEDKPLKYPDMFHGSQICIINKIDLLPYVNFNVEKAKEYALRLNPNMRFFEVSATTGEGMDVFYSWLKGFKK
jgi:hydrogenase nickel incorporation protein HypB